MLRLKTMRTQAGISQAQFAKDMGVAQNTVSNWENENRTLDAETLSRVADTVFSFLWEKIGKALILLRA